MGRISQWAVRRPWFALLTWLVLMFGIVFASIAWGGEYNDDEIKRAVVYLANAGGGKFTAPPVAAAASGAADAAASAASAP